MGKIELDHTGSGSGVTLSSDGTDLLLNGTAIGGGGGSALELYAENPSSPTAPSATGDNAVAIGSSAVASNNDAIALGHSYASGASAFAAAQEIGSSFYGALGANSIAIGRGARASTTRATAIGYSSVATGTNAIALGYVNTSSANNAYTFGNNNTASGQVSFAIGSENTTSQTYAGSYGIGASASKKGQIASKLGFLAQKSDWYLSRQTTDATPIALVGGSNTGSADTTNQIILPNNSAFAFHGTIVARQQASQGTACAAWKIEGLIRREGSEGTTVLVNSATTVLDNTPAWGMALTADTTNGGLKIEVTGAAATNIRWVATVHTSEVTY